MKNLTQEVKDELRSVIYNFFSEECEVELDQLNDDTNISDDLDGDSLMLVELIELLKKKYELNIQLQTIGKYLLKKPAETIGQAIDIVYLVYEYENDIITLGENA